MNQEIAVYAQRTRIARTFTPRRDPLEVQAAVRVTRKPVPRDDELATGEYLYFEVIHRDRWLGYVLGERADEQFAWRRFYPIERRELDPEYMRQGIGTLVHAQVVEYLRVHCAFVTVRHEALGHTSPSRRMHLSNMGLDTSRLLDVPLIVDFNTYQEKSLAYARQRGFDPARWQPVVDCSGQ